jgi:hypothetical protein
MLRVKKRLDRSWPYLFCLLLSLKGANRDEAETQATELFENLSEIAARQYVSGESVRFGFPRREIPAGFREALAMICTRLGEGRVADISDASRRAKDDGLDIVAWRPFPDRRPGQFIMFGQCAATSKWRDKTNELLPGAFTNLHLCEQLHVDPVKGFFTPFRLPVDRWREGSTYGGILFDRCRISFLTNDQDPPSGLVDWCEATVQELK